MSDDDTRAQLLEDAAGQVHAAPQVRGRPEHPGDLYARCGALVEILARLTQVATGLHDTTERAPGRFDLGSDDDTAAGQWG